MSEEIKLLKGNEAIAHAAIRYGADGYFGYPITPQSEIMETLMTLKPWESTGMVVLQAESEVAAINMVYGGAGSGKAVMTSSSSPGVSLKQEGISYLAGTELPALIVNVMRGMRNELYDALLNDGYKSLGEYDDRNPKKPMVRSV